MEPIVPETTPVENRKLGQSLGQFLRFIVVGLINTAINFIVLNILSHITGVRSGGHIIYLSLIAFAAATTNSYFLNDYWVFRQMGSHEGGRKFTLFLTVSIIGAGINSL